VKCLRELPERSVAARAMRAVVMVCRGEDLLYRPFDLFARNDMLEGGAGARTVGLERRWHRPARPDRERLLCILKSPLAVPPPTVRVCACARVRVCACARVRVCALTPDGSFPYLSTTVGTALERQNTVVGSARAHSCLTPPTILALTPPQPPSPPKSLWEQFTDAA